MIYASEYKIIIEYDILFSFVQFQIFSPFFFLFFKQCYWAALSYRDVRKVNKKYASDKSWKEIKKYIEVKRNKSKRRRNFCIESLEKDTKNDDEKEYWQKSLCGIKREYLVHIFLYRSIGLLNATISYRTKEMFFMCIPSKRLRNHNEPL